MATILIVDDEKAIVDLLVNLLEDNGYVVLTAINGEEALKILEQERPDLIISDVMMPMMDGLALLRQIWNRTEWRTIKIILSSAAPLKAADNIHFDKFISKPFDLDTLEQLVKSLLSSSV